MTEGIGLEIDLMSVIEKIDAGCLCSGKITAVIPSYEFGTAQEHLSICEDLYYAREQSEWEQADLERYPEQRDFNGFRTCQHKVPHVFQSLKRMSKNG